MKRILLFLLAAMAIFQNTDAQQCNATEVDFLPHSACWDVAPNQTNYIENPFGQIDPVYGCWNCMVQPVWFSFSPITDDILRMEIESEAFSWLDEYSPEQAIYYAVFTDCPFDGGKVISYPCNCNNPNGECWDEFGGQNNFIESSCFYASPYSWPLDWYCQTSEPDWNYPVSDYVMEFNLTAGEQYWIAVFPSASCDAEVHTYGEICVEFGGAVLLELAEDEAAPDTTGQSESIIYPFSEKVFTDEGMLIKVNQSESEYQLFDLAQRLIR